MVRTLLALALVLAGAVLVAAQAPARTSATPAAPFSFSA